MTFARCESGFLEKMGSFWGGYDALLFALPFIGKNLDELATSLWQQYPRKSLPFAYSKVLRFVAVRGVFGILVY